MTDTQQARPDLDLERGLESLDLRMMTSKLMDADEGQGWSSDYCAKVATEYRRFLALTRRYPDRAIVPSRIVDAFWHAHILDTQAYAPDCDRLFGFFLHHFPYFGMRGPEDTQALSVRLGRDAGALRAALWGATG